MKSLGELSGTGSIEINGEIIGQVTYLLNVWQEDMGGAKSADGHARGDFIALHAAFKAGLAKLHLKNGGSLDFTVTGIDSNGAKIKVSGPVPGFNGTASL